MRSLLPGLLFLSYLTMAIVFVPSAGSTVLLAAEEHASETHGDGSPPGPITNKPEDRDLAIWSLIVFAVFVAVLGKFAWKPLAAGLDKREAGVLGNIAAAESARMKAEKMLADHAEKLAKVQDEVHTLLAEARSDAEKTKNDIIAAAQKEADASRQRAVTDIERARDQALNELFEHMTRTVTDATQQVIGRSLNDADHQRLIQEALTGFSQRRT